MEGTAGNELVPDLAEAIPEPTDGGKTYAFTMREGIKFSTGETVKPSDIRYTIERNFKAAGPGSGFYASIVGADACAKKPKTCDLSEGIVADDAANTVTFKLTAADPDMLQKLAMPFAFVVPKGTPNKDIGTDPLPATGPYMITKYDPDSEMVFERNPEFKEWSAEAQPAGNPDKIVMKVGLPLEDATTQIQNGEADWMYDIPPADRLGEISTEFEQQVHVNPGPQVFHEALNTRVPPFDNKDVRQALNFATDRDAVIKIFGGPALATATCQILPPDFPGYQPYCPYTQNPGEKWTAPDMAKAKQLVDASGTKGQKVTIISTNDETTKADRPLLRLAAARARLRRRHQEPQRRRPVRLRPGLQQQGADELQLLVPGLPGRLELLQHGRGLQGLRAQQLVEPEPLAVLRPGDPEARTEAAMELQATDPRRGERGVGRDRQGDDRRRAVDPAVRRQPPRLRLRAARQLPVQPVGRPAAS